MVRLEIPFKVKCNACGEYIAEGRRFNARKETTDEKYLKIAIIRFYIRCPGCHNQVAFSTDPENSDYKCDFGARRICEPKRGDDLLGTYEGRHGHAEQGKAEHDRLKEVEEKAYDEKTNMAVADALEEIQARNADRERTQQVVGTSLSDTSENQDAKDARIARQAFAQKRKLEHQEDTNMPESSKALDYWTVGARKKQKQDLRGRLRLGRKLKRLHEA